MRINFDRFWKGPAIADFLYKQRRMPVSVTASVILGDQGRLSKMVKFCKNEDCPTSEDLLAFQTGDMPVRDGAVVRRHLAICEFCSAEVEFYESYPPAVDHDEPAHPGTMPEPLYQLAEALLAKKQDDAFFDRLMESEL